MSSAGFACPVCGSLAWLGAPDPVRGRQCGECGEWCAGRACPSCGSMAWIADYRHPGDPTRRLCGECGHSDHCAGGGRA